VFISKSFIITLFTDHMSIARNCSRVLLASLAAALVACGGDSTAPPVPVQAATVQATPSKQFTPGNVAVLQGGTVTFAFGSLGHNVFFDNAPAGAPANITATTSNQSQTLTFNTKGTFPYNCHIHPGMRGTVVVE
jgi:plastocyanin